MCVCLSVLSMCVCLSVLHMNGILLQENCEDQRFGVDVPNALVQAYAVLKLHREATPHEANVHGVWMCGDCDDVLEILEILAQKQHVLPRAFVVDSGSYDAVRWTGTKFQLHYVYGGWGSIHQLTNLITNHHISQLSKLVKAPRLSPTTEVQLKGLGTIK